jgi:hypothetical protein
MVRLSLIRRRSWESSQANGKKSEQIVIELAGRKVKLEPAERVMHRIRLYRVKRRFLNPLAFRERPCEHSRVAVKVFAGGGLK